MIEIYSDGSHLDDMGGWASVIIEGDRHTLIAGGRKWTTNNQMELDGPIKALEFTPIKSHVKITSDSEYFVKGFNDWMHRWQKKGWIREKQEPPKNKDRWEKLFDLKAERSVRAEWIRSHVESSARPHILNNLCDMVATICRKEQNQIHLTSESFEELIQQINERYPRIAAKTSRFLYGDGIQRDGVAETT